MSTLIEQIIIPPLDTNPARHGQKRKRSVENEKALDKLHNEAGSSLGGHHTDIDQLPPPKRKYNGLNNQQSGSCGPDHRYLKNNDPLTEASGSLEPNSTPPSAVSGQGARPYQVKLVWDHIRKKNVNHYNLNDREDEEEEDEDGDDNDEEADNINDSWIAEGSSSMRSRLLAPERVAATKKALENGTIRYKSFFWPDLDSDSDSDAESKPNLSADPPRDSVSGPSVRPLGAAAASAANNTSTSFHESPARPSPSQYSDISQIDHNDPHHADIPVRSVEPAETGPVWHLRPPPPNDGRAYIPLPSPSPPPLTYHNYSTTSS